MTRAPSQVYQDHDPTIASPSCLGEGWLCVGGSRPTKQNPALFGPTEAPTGRTCTPQGHPIISFTLIKNSLFSAARDSHVAWVPPSLPNSIVLLGGWGASHLTAEIVPGFKKWSSFHLLCCRWRNLCFAPQWIACLRDSRRRHDCDDRRRKPLLCHKVLA